MEQQSQELDFRRYLLLVYKRRYLSLAVAITIMTAAVALCFIQKPVYEAKTIVLIERNFTNELIKDITVTPSIEDRLRFVTVVMTSRGLLTGVLKEIGIDLDAMTPEQAEKTIASVQKRTEIDLGFGRGGSGTMDAFTVSFRDGNPKRAMEYVNLLVRSYIGDHVLAKRDEVYGASSFLSDQMDFFKKKIETAEQAVRRVRAEHGVAARQRLAGLQRKLNSLLMMYTENHPEVIKTRVLMDELKEEIERKQLAAQRQTQEANATGDRDKLANLVRERDAYKKIYADLVASLSRSEVSTQVELQNKADTFRILEPAIMPTRPVSPNRVKLMLLGLFGGVAGGIGIVLVLDYFDDSVKTLDTLKSFGLPVLAIIPNMRNAAELAKQKKTDVLVYSLAGTYMACFMVFFAKEFLSR